ncbi:P-type domain-containing protein [Aphelenchoides fujianensis]|nr:P-type domain-containing protein [Aphelenchoides fujianensis]
MRSPLLIAVLLAATLAVGRAEAGGEAEKVRTWREIADQAANFVDPGERVDCGPEPDISEDKCKSRGCVWSPTSTPVEQNVPWCHFPASTGYFVAKNKKNAVWTKSPKSPPNPFGSDAQQVNFKQQSLDAGLRFVPDVDLNYTPTIQSTEQLVLNIKNTSVASFTIERQSSGVRLWDTSIGGLLFGDKYIQLATFIPTNKLFGFGEHIHQTLKHDLSGYRTWPMFARDKPPNSADGTTENLYGVHNFYIAIEDDGKAHGVFFLNSNPQEVVTGPGPHIVYRALGGRFDFFFLPGPTPAQVVEQYQQIVGRPYLPAYWALGYQFCRYGYTSVDEVKATIGRIQNAQIPIDVVYADIDYMERYKDFTTGSTNWSSFAAYADELHQKDMKITLIFDPAIEVDYDSFQRAVDQDANFISWPAASYVDHEIQDLYPLAKETNFMLAVVWPDNHVAFPDFYDDTGKTDKWWYNEFDTYHKIMGFDGVWIDMNEPSSFGTNQDKCCDGIAGHPDDKPLHCPLEGDDSVWEYPPYRTWSAYHYGDIPLSDKTVCMIGVVNRGKQRVFETKNLYGLKETISTAAAIKGVIGKRSQLISRSTFPSTGRYGGHWLGDNTARWEDLRTAIIGAQEFNMFGITHVGSDVCGFIGDTNEELCLRWQQLGAFHSFFRNHNTIGAKPQDPPQWNSVAQATRTANLFRYRHLPYLYSLHFAASMKGGTVIRPVAFEFPRDRRAFDLSHQFMWGPAVMVIPVTEDGVDSVDGYLPEDAEWYYMYDGTTYYGTRIESGDVTVDAPRNSSAPAFIRGGSVVPRQVPGLTTTATRKNHFQVLIAGNKKIAPIQQASGTLYWDDGESLIDFDSASGSGEYYQFDFNFSYTNIVAQLNITMVKSPTNRLTLPPIEEIEVFGYIESASIKSVTVNGAPAQLSAKESFYSGITNVLRLKRSDTGFVQLNDHLDQWTIEWHNIF